MVIPARRFHLDVLAHTRSRVHGLGRHYVEGKCLVAGRCVEPVGPPALVEHSILEIRLAVEHQSLYTVPVLAHAHTAQGEIALHSVIAKRELNVVQIRLLWRPGLDFPQLQQRGRPRLKVVGITVYHGVYYAFTAAAYLHSAVLEVRRYEEGVYVVIRHTLAPDRLPDAAHRAVPDAARLELLLSARVVAAVRLVRHTYHEAVLTLAEQVRYVRGKRQIPAGVYAGVLTVHPDPGHLVSRSEVQQDPSHVEALRQLELAPVPEIFPRLQHPAHA